MIGFTGMRRLIIETSAWMLDPASCVGMEIGAPRASMVGLAALHELLVGQDFFDKAPPMTEPLAGRSSMKSLPVPAGPPGEPRQLSMALNAPTLHGLNR